MTFCLKDNKKIFLYGAASIGKIVFNNLRNQNINVDGFIDKRSSEIGFFLGVPVISFEDFCSENKNAIIIISVKNVFDHNEIAERFVTQGFYNLVFKPKETLEGRADRAKKSIGDLYDNLLDDCFDSATEVPQTKEVSNYYFKDYALYQEIDDEVVAFVPCSHIFTNDYDEDKQKWGNVNVLCLFTHDDFFSSLLGNTAKNEDYYLSDYCEYVAKKQGDVLITDNWRKNVINNRAMIFDQMKLTNEIDHDFFIRNSATGVWNSEKKYFNLTGGKHRCMFFVSLGYYYIPLRIKKNDYMNYIQMDKLCFFQKSINLCHKYHGIINNPYFYRISDIGISFITHTIRIVANLLAKKVYQKRNKVCFNDVFLIDYSNNFNSVSRFFAHCGLTVYRHNNNECEKFVDEVEETFIQKPSHLEKYDVVFIEENINDSKLLIQKHNDSIVFYFSRSCVCNLSNATLISKGYYIDSYFYVYCLENIKNV